MKKTFLSLALVVLCGCSDQIPEIEVGTSSMSPTFMAGDKLRVDRFDARKRVLRRFDIVLFVPPNKTNQIFAFRIVGLPDETVSLSSAGLSINGVPFAKDRLPEPLRKSNEFPVQNPVQVFGNDNSWTLKRDEVFVVGDNLKSAYDSRYWGPLPVTNILGIVVGVDSSRRQSRTEPISTPASQR